MLNITFYDFIESAAVEEYQILFYNDRFLSFLLNFMMIYCLKVMLKCLMKGESTGFLINRGIHSKGNQL